MVKNHLIMLTTLYICCGLSVTRHVEEIIILRHFQKGKRIFSNEGTQHLKCTLLCKVTGANRLFMGCLS